MKLTNTVGGFLLLALTQACGGTEEGGADVGKFVGKWTYQPGGKLVLACGGAPIEMPLSGTVTISAGSTADLSATPENTDCTLPLAVTGASAQLKAATTCTMMGFNSMVSKWSVNTADGASNDTTFSAKASGMFGGMMLSCDVTGTGKMTKTAP